ncbi:DUF7283 family protein [Halopiger goleimassiliensis]|uniref:DUF7283 family protein n=1 Tax=Halopiger goleimassiliensis TaxID=1293048 RepID=UPI000677C3B1|nr:hypothetical protein [Halopiger goleimassiliensis]
MDFEAPVDAWYVYVAVVIITVALAGIVLGLPSAPPPDAQQAANAIEGATATEYSSGSTYEHDAETVTIDRRTITMENEHGTAHASFAFGTVVPVNGYDRLENLTYGTPFEAEFADELADPHTDAKATFFSLVDAADEQYSGSELVADGELVARTVAVEPDPTVGLEVKVSNNEAFADDLEEGDDDLEDESFAIPGTVELRPHGSPENGTNVTVYGTTLTDELDVDDPDGWFEFIYTSALCFLSDDYCDDEPDVEPYDEVTEPIANLSASPHHEITLVEGDLDDVTDTDADEVEVWAGTYDLVVEATGADFGSCSAPISADDAGEWIEVCGPDLSVGSFDDPHWHDDRGGVHYVTLVTV